MIIKLSTMGIGFRTPGKTMKRLISTLILAFVLLPVTVNAQSLPDNLDKSLSQLITNLNENEFSDSLLLENQEQFNEVHAYYLIYQSRMESQLQKLEAAGLDAKYDRLEDYRSDFESDVGTIVNALSSYYAQETDTDSTLSNLLSELQQLVSYYWAQFNIGQYYESLEKRFVPVLHSNSFPTQSIENYNVDLALRSDYQTYSVGPIETQSDELLQYNVDVMNKAKELNNSPVAIYDFVNKLPSDLYWGSKKSLSATLISGGNAMDKSRLLADLFRSAGFESHLVDGVIKMNVQDIQAFLGVTHSDDILDILKQAGQAFTIENLNGQLHSINLRHTWVEAELPFKNYRGHGVESDARNWVSLDAFYTGSNHQIVSTDQTVSPQQMVSYQKTAIGMEQATSPISDLFGESIEQEEASNKQTLAYLPASLPFEVMGYYEKFYSVPKQSQQMVNVSLVEPGWFGNELFNVSIPAPDLYAKSIVLTYIPATVEDQALTNALGGMDMVPAYLLNVLPVLEIDGKRHAMGKTALTMADVLQLNIQYETPFSKTISKDVLAGGYYAIAFNDSIGTYQSDETIGLGASMLNESAQLYLQNWIQSEAIIETHTGVKYHYPVPSIAIMANSHRISYFDDEPVALEWKGVELDAIFHAANVSVLDQSIDHYVQDMGSIEDEEIQSLKQSLEAAVNRLTGFQASWYESEIIKNYFNVEAISADALIALAVENGSTILTESNLTESEIQTFPEYMQQYLNWAANNQYEIHVTKEKQTVNDWQGYGWVITDPQTGHSGYYLSGAIAGGASTDSSDVIWQLVDPEESAPSSGIGSFSYLNILSDHSDIKTANDVSDLVIEARGYFNEVVSDVPITVLVSLGSGSINDSQAVTVYTDQNGKAKLSLRYGPKISEGLLYDSGEKYLQKYGILNLSLSVANRPQENITAYFKPAKGTIKVTPNLTEGPSTLREFSYTLRAEDAYGNRVANVPFTVSADRDTPEFGEEPFILLFGEDVDVQVGELNSSTTIRSRNVSFNHNRYLGPTRLKVKNESGTIIQENEFVTLGGDDPYDNPWYVEQEYTGDIDIIGHPDYYFDPVSGLDTIRRLRHSSICRDQPKILLKSLVADRFIYPVNQTSLIAQFPINDICGEYVAIAATEFYNYIEKIEGVTASYIAESSNTSIVSNDVLYHAGSEPGTVQVKISTKSIPEIYYGSEDFKLDITLVKGEIEAPYVAQGIYSDGSFKLNTPYQVYHTLLPDESIQLDLGVSLNLYQDGMLIDRYQSESGSATGIVGLPIGYEFDTNSKYEVEVVFGHSSIRSEKVPVIFPLIREHSRNIKFKQYVDVSNSLSCTMGSSIGFIETTYDTIVTITATELFKQTDPTSAVEVSGESIELVTDLLVPAGVSTEIPIDTSIIQPGAYQLTITATSSELGLSETVTSILDYKLEHEDTLPVGHSLYQGVDLADASLNLSRQDAVIPGNTSASSLNVARRYNSKNASQEYFGAGWSDSNLVTLQERPCGYVIANGIRFIKSSGGYTAAKGHHGTLEERGDSYLLTTVGGTQYFFEEHREGIHRVLNVKYADGYTVKYAYQNNTDDIRLSRMDDNFDRFIEYEYSDFEKVSGFSEIMTRVTTINVNDVKTLEYTYDGYARLSEVQLQTKGFGKKLIEQYDYSKAISVDEAQHETYKEQNEYPSIEYPSFFEDYVLGTNQQSQRLPLLLSVTDALGQSTSYTYEPQKLNKLIEIDPRLESYGYPTVVSITNKNGDTTNISYEFAGTADGSATIARPIGSINYELDNYGSAKKITDDAGFELFSFNDRHLLEEHTDKNGHVTTYTYDSDGNKTSEEVGGTTTEYNYGKVQTQAGEARNALLSKTTGKTIVEFKYNGQCPTPEYQSFPEVKRAFDEHCQIVTEVDGAGNTKTYTYDEESRLKKIIKKGNSGERFSKTINWSDVYTKSSETDFNGHLTRFEYNHLGQVIKQTNPNGDDHIFNRDDIGQIKSEIDVLGRTTTYDYDAMGNQTEITYKGHTQVFEYDDNGNRESATDWLGRKVIFEYNDADQLVKEIHPLGKVINYDPDGNGNVLTETITVDGVIQKTVREYDEQNRLVKETDAENYVQSWDYDDSNNLETFTNKNNVVTTYKYDTNGQPTEMTTGNRTWKYSYNEIGQKIKETDPTGGVTHYKYDGSGNVIYIQKTGDGIWNYQFDGEGNKIFEANPLSETTTFTYNKINGLTNKQDALNHNWIYTLDELNRIETERHPNGETITYGYDDFDRQISYEDTIGTLWSRTYDAVGNLKTETDGKGHTTTHFYNDLNQRETTKLPNTGEYVFTYDELGQKKTETDPRQHTTTFTYDKVGNIEKQTNHLNQSVVTTFDGMGNPLTITDARANTTHYQYNDFNERTHTTNALGHVITMTYDGIGRVLTETDAKGYVTENTYREYSSGKSVVTKRNGITLQTQKFNVGGQLIAAIDAEKNTIAYKYDALGRKLEEVHPLSTVLQFEYDEVGNLESFKDGENRETTYTYDARNQKETETLDGITITYEYDDAGNQTALIDGKNLRWAYTYTPLNQLETITTPDNVVTEHQYDLAGNRTHTINGKQQTTEWEYDELNRIKTLTYPEGDQYTYLYDPAGNLKNELLPNNEQVDFEYDDINRLSKRTDSNGTIDYVYDNNGNVTSQTQTNTNGEGSGTETFTYDQFDRMTSKQDIYGNVSRFKYDKNGNQTGLGYGWANDYSVAYSYDAKNRLTGVTHGFGSTSLSYYRDDRIQTKTHDNGVTTTYDYDGYGNLTTLSHKQGSTVIHQFGYDYDNNQNRTQETEFNGIDTIITDFDYDDQNRLTHAIYTGDSQPQNNGTATYRYDDNGNRETETFTTAAGTLTKNITYGYDNNDQLTSISNTVDNSNTVVGYDSLGNLTQKAQTIDSQTETTNYIYDARNQLKQVQVGGSTVGQFLYDANGLRIHKTETQTDAQTQIANTTHQRYHYQGLNVIGSFDENNNSQYRYYHDGNQILARINESAFSDTSVENTAVQTYHQDGLGSTAVISNRDGSLTARYQYDAFGNVQTETGQSETNDFTYTGHERDQATGLIYAKARYYDPQLGLFLSRDSFEGYDNKPLSLHRYLYAYQNPMKYVDPDGKEPVTATAIAVYLGWSGLNAGINTGIDYGFHKVFGDEGDKFDLGENYATNFAISTATGGVGAYAKHAPKLKKIGETAVEFSGEVTKEYLANRENGASIPEAAADTFISMTIGKAAADTIGKKAGELYDGVTGVIGELKTKLGAAVKDADSAVTNSLVREEIAALSRIKSKVSNKTELNQQINLRGATADEYARLLDEGVSFNKMGPALAGVMDSKTGKIFFGKNSGAGEIPNVLSPEIREGLEDMPDEILTGYIKTKGAGTHAEVHALNEAMLERMDSKKSEFLLQVINSGGSASTRGKTIPRCPHCAYLTDGVKFPLEPPLKGK